MTGALAAEPLEPPPDPYGRVPATSATLSGLGGRYSVRAGTEVRVGRDPAHCAIALSEPRVSGIHATLKVEAGQLWARDEQSNNGTFVAGERIAPGQWTVVPNGAVVRFGPIELAVRLGP